MEKKIILGNRKIYYGEYLTVTGTPLYAFMREQIKKGRWFPIYDVIGTKSILKYSFGWESLENNLNFLRKNFING